MNILKVLLFVLGIIAFTQPALAKKCTGEFVNPITDICWKCLFPITLGSFEVVGSKLHDTKNPSSPICICPRQLGPITVPTPGITGGFWEPSRLVDISAEPYCFVNMGGLEMDMGFERSQGGRPTSSSSQISRWYVHYYAYPIIYILEIFMDFICLERLNFDVLWITEIDPTGSDDELSMLLHPEAFLFNNLLAQAACSADCVSASSGSKGKPIDSLFWCSGCQGSMYPMNGNVNAHIGGVQATLNATQKMIYKMHRQGMAHETASSDLSKICDKHLALVMKKSHYRYQMTNPDPDKCAPFGRSTTFFESKKEIPITSEDFGFLLWRKRNCCIL
ncbi:Conjugal transfer pilus assembly protein TraU [Candidatus Jidaibacter acanthamoeba]|uniref:Conjugal transfer pilus assembly protein TraU n=1 Tax=Candidatus Jidaibacter acanthamoebae TaxID=86105 RepID=A0A0C1MQH9_9RICK|nr:conjugal transfer pilus assembly protein TraU [Candidatus Jidaibacter acanthamoeba]KIE04242.1 Conjugal transfer pilus assembly protein TraU [Candidatus Jidaibacter acanthamoeba]